MKNNNDFNTTVKKTCTVLFVVMVFYIILMLAQVSS